MVLAEVVEEVGGAFLHHRVFVEAADLQGVNRRRRAREAGVTLRLVAEAAGALVLAALHVGDRLVNGALGHFEAAVLRRADGDERQHGHGDVGVLRDGPVAPAAFVAGLGGLRADDDLHRLVELGPHGRGLGLAVKLGERDGGDAVGIHVLAVAPHVVEAVGADGVEEVVHPGGDVLAVFALAGEVAGGLEGHEGVAGHRDLTFGFLAAETPRAGGLLLRSEILEAALDDRLGFGVHDDGVLGTRGGAGGSGGEGGLRQCAEAEGGERGLEELFHGNFSRSSRRWKWTASSGKDGVEPCSPCRPAKSVLPA